MSDRKTIYLDDAIDAISTWDKFGIDERSRIVRWHEGLEPYVKLRDVVLAIEKLPSAQRWIPCSEGLPKKDDGYLCTLDDGSMMLVSYSDGYFRVMNPNVIAWMPLPEPFQRIQDVENTLDALGKEETE